VYQSGVYDHDKAARWNCLQGIAQPQRRDIGHLVVRQPDAPLIARYVAYPTGVELACAPPTGDRARVAGVKLLRDNLQPAVALQTVVLEICRVRQQ
jgi:hypothetical protein